jgi:hypothetical protein
MTSNSVNKFVPESNETQKGHINQTKQGVRSTKVIDEDTMLEAEALLKPTSGVKFEDV